VLMMKEAVAPQGECLHRSGASIFWRFKIQMKVFRG
jgi:hypothetical protein